jgi:hypothetical protein
MTLDCLEEYICSSEHNDPEFLWALCEVFSPHSTEPGRHAVQIIRARKHVAEIAQANSSKTDGWSEKLDLFIRTSITPRYWPEELQQADGFIAEPEDQSSSYRPSSPDTLVLDGVNRPIGEIKTILGEKWGRGVWKRWTKLEKVVQT